MATFEIDGVLVDDRMAIRVDLWYPPNHGITEQFVTIGLSHVRAADSIKVRYDFERDGWVVQMDKTKYMGSFSDVLIEDDEVAFVPSWNEDE
jgi:hypothetical protein